MSADLETLVRDAVLATMSRQGWTSGADRAPARVGLLEPETPMHVHGRHSGSDFCTHCGGCMEPAVYEHERRGVPQSVAEMIDRLDRFTELSWKTEPQDVRRLRQLSRPPMGRMPGVLYANFNLFWLGEILQTIRDKARAGRIPIEHLNEMLSAACLRSAIRLSKWKLLDVIFLLTDVVGFADKVGCRNQAEMKELVEHVLIAVDRIQAWVDRMIPWHHMDAVMEPVP